MLSTIQTLQTFRAISSLGSANIPLVIQDVTAKLGASFCLRCMLLSTKMALIVARAEVHSIVLAGLVC
jgi:hypothetical protein